MEHRYATCISLNRWNLLRGMRAVEFITPFAVLLFSSLITETTQVNICVESTPNCEGPDNICSRSVPCYQGDCDDDGRCVCSACWAGRNCDQYVDNYPPKFYVASKYVTVSAHDSGALFTAYGYDADQMQTCHNEIPCPCSEFLYDIVSGNDDQLFEMDPRTGVVTATAGRTLQPGKAYELVISLSSPGRDGNRIEPQQDNLQQVTINVRPAEDFRAKPQVREDFAVDLNDENQYGEHRISKRSVGPTNETSILLYQLNADNATTLSAGDKIDFNVQITIPPGVSMDLNVELLTSDPETNNAAYELCSATVSALPAAITSTIANIQPQYSQNQQIPDIYDEAVIDFGVVTTAASAAATDCVINIMFSAIMIASPNITDGSNYSIVAGAAYDNDSYIWIAQATFAAQVPSTDSPYPSSLTIDGPDSIAVNGYGLYTISLFTAMPYGSLEIDVFGNGATADSFSTGAIVLSSAAANFPCLRPNLLSYPYALIPSSSGVTMARSMMYIMAITNTDDTGRAIANLTGNELVIQFLVTVPNDDTLDGTILPLSATAMLNEKTIWTNIMNISVTSQDTSNTLKGAATMTVVNNTIAMMAKGTAVFTLNIKIPQNKYSNVVVEILAPATPVNPGVLSICAVTPVYGVNIPTVAIPDPEFTSRSGDGTIDQAIVNIGRVWNSAMVTGNDSADTLALNVTVRSLSASSQGQTISVILSETEGGSSVGTGSVTVEILEVDPDQAAETSSVSITMLDALNGSSVGVESDSAVQMVMSFTNTTRLDSLSVEMMTTLSNETIVARICRANVVSVGKKLPCLQKKMVNKQVDYQRVELQDMYDSASMELGPVCLGDDDGLGTPDSQVVLSVAFELPVQASAVAGQTFTLYSGIKLGNASIWAGSATYDFANPIPDVTSPTCSVYVNATLSPDTPAYPGSAAVVLLNVKFPPQTRSSYRLTLSSAATDQIGICQVYIIYLGYNFPCVDPNPWPGNVSRAATTRINYNSFDATLNSSHTAILDFGSMSNLGNTIFSTETVYDHNTILVAVAVKIGQAATGSLTLQYQLDNGTQTGTPVPFAIPVTAGAPPVRTMVGNLSRITVVQYLGWTWISALTDKTATTSPNVTLNPYNGTTDIHVNVTKVVILMLEIPENTLADVSIDFTNPNMAANDYGFCSAAITHVGKNLPCLNSSSVLPTLDGAAAGGNCSNSLTMALGQVCQTMVVNDTAENWVTIEVGLNILDPKFSGSITVQASATVGTATVSATPLSLTSDNSDLPPSTTNLTTALLSNVSVPISIGSKTWIDVNVTIPADSTIGLRFGAIAASADGRAFMTIVGVKVSAAGINVACVKNASYFIFEPTNSSNVNTSQKNQLDLDFGYVTNTGFTYRQGFNQSWDDEFTISVQIRMADHPQATQNSQWPLNFTFEMDNGYVSEESQMLTVVRNATEKPDIVAQAEILNPKLFQANEIINVGLVLSHSDSSSAEPTKTSVRLLLPAYMNYSSGLTANTTIYELYDSMVSLVMSNPFLFSDIYQINFTLTVDPYDRRGPTASMINATTIGRVMTNVFAQTVNGAQYPLTDAPIYTGQGFFLVYGIVGEGCHDPLGMAAGTIQDCQLTASTVVDPAYGPEHARIGTPAGTVWKPALRDPSFKDYLQVNFGNKTRVAKIAFQKDACCRAPMSVLLQYSDNGAQWTDGYKDSNLNYTGDTAQMDLGTPFEGRMLRIIINSTDEPENLYSKYAGIRVEFYGCVLSGDVAQNDVCSSYSQPIINSNDANQYRHISVDTSKNAVFACDISPNTWKLGCFCSSDGAAWKILPSYVNNIIGYDGASGNTFARDQRNITILKSLDCLTWFISTTAELQAAQQGGQFVSSTVLAGLVQSDPGITKSVGSWKGRFHLDSCLQDNKLRTMDCI